MQLVLEYRRIGLDDDWSGRAPRSSYAEPSFDPMGCSGADWRNKLQDVPARHFTFHQNKAAQLLNLMASPVRIEILKRLTAREWDVNSLSLELKITQSALSQHLAKLRASEMVDTRRDAQRIFYSSNSTAVLAVLTVLAELVDDCSVVESREQAGRVRRIVREK